MLHNLLLKRYNSLCATSEFQNRAISSSENALQQNDKTNMFLVYPNPAKDILHVQTNGKASFSLTDQSGKYYLQKILMERQNKYFRFRLQVYTT